MSIVVCVRTVSFRLGCLAVSAVCVGSKLAECRVVTTTGSSAAARVGAIITLRGAVIARFSSSFSRVVFSSTLSCVLTCIMFKCPTPR
jgi:hypothetical protein